MMDWITKAVFYHIYPLGFLRSAPLQRRRGTGQPDRKLVDWIPHLKELGVNAVYLGPVFESASTAMTPRTIIKSTSAWETGTPSAPYAAVCMKAASAWCWMGCLTMWAGNSGLFGMYSKTAGAPATAAGSTT